MKENSKNPREIDILTKDIGSWSKKTFVFMKKAEVKTWHGVLIITFVCGIFTALIWAISFKQSPFLLAAPKYTGTANLSWDANSESDLAGYNIYYGTSHRTGDDPNACSLCGYENKISVGSDTTDYSFDDLINSKTYYFSVTAFDNSGNESSFSSEVNKTTEADVDPPILSAGAPSGTLDSGTVQTNLTLSTDEDANCKYSTTAGIAYASMANTFSATGETDHSVAVTGLSNGNTYHYYVRCQDEALAPNANSNDYEITFSISSAADIAAPVRSEKSPSGELQVGTTSTTLSLTTNESATCKYGTIANTSYGLIVDTFSTTGSNEHSAIVSGLSDGHTYNYYVRCQDKASSPNTNNNDYVITFSVGQNVIITDTNSPILSAGAPSGTLDSGTVQTNLTLSTDEDANCKYSTTAGIAYASMANTFSATGETDHSVAVTGLSNGNTYHYYVRCQDEALAPNANSNDYEITFSISSAADIAAPVRSDGSPKNELSSKITSATLSLVTNENATCKYGTTSNADYNSMANTFSTTGGTNHSSEIAGLSEGKSYNYYVRCQDEKNNLNNDDYVISFSIDKKSSSKDKEKPAPKRSISNRPKVVSRGQMLVQSGKRFSKSSNVAVYFSRPQGSYYNPQIVKTNRAGKFNIVYKVNKPAGKYGWYAVDLKTGRKSKTIVYRVK